VCTDFRWADVVPSARLTRSTSALGLCPFQADSGTAVHYLTWHKPCTWSVWWLETLNCMSNHGKGVVWIHVNRLAYADWEFRQRVLWHLVILSCSHKKCSPDTTVCLLAKTDQCSLTSVRFFVCHYQHQMFFSPEVGLASQIRRPQKLLCIDPSEIPCLTVFRLPSRDMLAYEANQP
jgi:hypothetical protein